MSAVLDRRGYTFFPTPLQMAQVTRDMRFRPDPSIGFGIPRAFSVFTRNVDGSVTVPRAWGIRQMGAPLVRLPPGAPIPESVQLSPGFVLDETRCQVSAVAAIRDVLGRPIERGGGIGLISLPCGGGKTVLFIYVIFAIIRRKAAIVVHTNQLADQWEERLRAFCPTVRIGRVQAQVADVAGVDVIICMLQTLSMRSDLPVTLLREVGVMVIDECHLVSTETFSRVLSRWNVLNVFGLSATPQRKDKLEAVLHAHIGGVVFQGSRERVPVRVIFRHTDVSGHKEIFNPRTKKLDQVAMVSNLVADAERTRLVAREAIAYASTKVLVLSERRAHLEDIRSSILEVRPDMDENVGMYMGQMKAEALKASEQCMIILGTYSIASVGLDIKGLNTLILATPRSDVVQATGRIQRETTPSVEKVIVDIYDCFSVFAGQYAKRHAYYKKAGFVVEGARARHASAERKERGGSARIDADVCMLQDLE